jgi:hypothetical protein
MTFESSIHDVNDSSELLRMVIWVGYMKDTKNMFDVRK